MHDRRKTHFIVIHGVGFVRDKLLPPIHIDGVVPEEFVWDASDAHGSDPSYRFSEHYRGSQSYKSNAPYREIAHYRGPLSGEAGLDRRVAPALLENLAAASMQGVFEGPFMGFKFLLQVLICSLFACWTAALALIPLGLLLLFHVPILDRVVLLLAACGTFLLTILLLEFVYSHLRNSSRRWRGGAFRCVALMLLSPIVRVATYAVSLGVLAAAELGPILGTRAKSRILVVSLSFGFHALAAIALAWGEAVNGLSLVPTLIQSAAMVALVFSAIAASGLVGVPAIKAALDALQYIGGQANRDQILEELEARVHLMREAQGADRVVIIGHSLGSVIAADSLRNTDIWDSYNSVTLVTMGCPIRRIFMRFFPLFLFDADIEALTHSIKAKFDQFAWRNVYRPLDYVGASLGFPNSGASCTDTSTGQRWKSHTGYWSDRRVHAIVFDLIARSWELPSSPEPTSHDSDRVQEQCQEAHPFGLALRAADMGSQVAIPLFLLGMSYSAYWMIRSGMDPEIAAPAAALHVLRWGLPLTVFAFSLRWSIETVAGRQRQGRGKRR